LPCKEEENLLLFIVTSMGDWFQGYLMCRMKLSVEEDERVDMCIWGSEKCFRGLFRLPNLTHSGNLTVFSEVAHLPRENKSQELLLELTILN